VEAHGGTIEIENRPAGGARFIIKIPTEIPDIKNLQEQEDEGE
jgi:signal transduction histidine kinase